MCFPDVLGWILVNILLPLLVGGVNRVGVFPQISPDIKYFSLNIFGIWFFSLTIIQDQPS